MVVWEFPCESRTLLNFYLCLGTEKPVTKVTGFLLSETKLFLSSDNNAMAPPALIHLLCRGASEVNAVAPDKDSVWEFFSLCESRTLLGFY